MVEVGQGAKDGVDVAVVGDVVAEVGHGRGVKGRDPYRLDAQPSQVIEPLQDALKIADAIAVRSPGKTADIPRKECRTATRLVDCISGASARRKTDDTLVVMTKPTKPLNKYSSQITQPKSQGASQAMLYATGLREPDMAKPQVGIASVWYEGNPCNMHLLHLAEKVKEGVIAAGMVGLRFNTIGVSDGISMGTDGMSYSLQSRDLIADSIETVMAAQWYDANVSIPGCDKNMPGCLIAMGRLNRPSLMVYGGTIRAGHLRRPEAGHHLRLPELRPIHHPHHHR